MAASRPKQIAAAVLANALEWYDFVVFGCLVSVLGLARRFVAVREGIAAEVLADQADLRALAEWHLDDRPQGPSVGVLSGWRRAVLGELMLAALSGKIAFRADAASPAGVEVVRS